MPTPHQVESITIGDATIPTVNVFKCMRSMFSAECISETDVNYNVIVKAAWDKYSEVSGVSCDTKMRINLKYNILAGYPASLGFPRPTMHQVHAICTQSIIAIT